MVIPTNPAARLGRYLPERSTTPTGDILPFTSAELASYLQAMEAHYPQYYPYFLCLARTGMREGEALGTALGLISSLAGLLTIRTASSMCSAPMIPRIPG